MQRCDCGQPAPWVLGSYKQRVLKRFCLNCAVQVHRTGKWLMLVHSVPL